MVGPILGDASCTVAYVKDGPLVAKGIQVAECAPLYMYFNGREMDLSPSIEQTKPCKFSNWVWGWYWCLCDPPTMVCDPPTMGMLCFDTYTSGDGASPTNQTACSSGRVGTQRMSIPCGREWGVPKPHIVQI